MWQTEIEKERDGNVGLRWPGKDLWGSCPVFGVRVQCSGSLVGRSRQRLLRSLMSHKTAFLHFPHFYVTSIHGPAWYE